MFAQQSQKSDTYTARLPFGSTQKAHKVMTKTILYKIYRKRLFQKVALGYILHFVHNGSSKHIENKNTHFCTTISRIRQLRGLASIWEHKKNVKFWQNQFYINIYREILFQKVTLGYLLHFLQNGSSKSISNTHTHTHFAQQSQTSEKYTAQLPFGSTTKT